jgi:hypothetical protein
MGRGPPHTMTLDIRLPIGRMFLTFGALLLGYGTVSDRAIYARSLDINVNVWWGLVLLIFGGAMTYYGRRASRTDRPRRVGSAVPEA